MKPLPAFRGAISAPSYIFSRPTGQAPVLLAIGFEEIIRKQLLHDKISFPGGRGKFINAVDISTDLKYFSKQILIKGGMMLLRTMITSVSCILLAFIVLSENVQAGTIYEYVDKDGSVVFTDSPPPETKVSPVENYRDMTEAEEQELEKEKTASMQKYQKSTEKRQAKEEKIRAARAEYEQALKDDQRYRSNKNQASGFAQQRHWIQMMEEQIKVIEEKKKKLQELESGP